MRLLVAAVSAAETPSGVCRHACNLVRCAITREEIDSITVLVGSWQRDYFIDWDSLSDKKVNLVDVGIPNRSIFRNIWYFLCLPRVAKRLNADIVHLAFPVPIMRRMFRGAVIASLHDVYPYDRPENFGFPAVWFNRAFLRRCLREIDLAVCVSEATMARFEVWAPRFFSRKSTTIHNCIDVSPITSNRGPHQFGENAPFFLMVAQHRANKNIELALNVFSELLQREEVDDKTQLIIVGNPGPETTKIKERIGSSDLKTKVRLVDGLSDKELWDLYRNCEVLLVPSLAEGFCLPVIEALCFGSRVVCSDIPVLREIGLDACHYFDLQAASPMEAMISVILMALREDKHKAIVFERFSVESIAAKYMAVYRQITATS